MVRTQIQLTEKQLRHLRGLASSTGRSIADLVREGVDLYLQARHRPSREETIQKAREVAGQFASGSPGGGREPDQHYADGFQR